MNKMAKTPKSPVPLKVQQVHYLRIGTKINYTPCKERNGIRCTGDKFDYIVAWQIDEKRRERDLAELP